MANPHKNTIPHNSSYIKPYSQSSSTPQYTYPQAYSYPTQPQLHYQQQNPPTQQPPPPLPPLQQTLPQYQHHPSQAPHSYHYSSYPHQNPSYPSPSSHYVPPTHQPYPSYPYNQPPPGTAPYDHPPPPGHHPGAPPGLHPPRQYGAPPPPNAPPIQASSFKNALQQCIQERNLSQFYPPNSPIIDQIAGRAASQVDQMCTKWRIPREIGVDVIKLALYDIILYIDDSGSMQFEENGERIKDLEVILQRVAYVATLFDDDGVSVRFMNSSPPSQYIDNIRSDQQINALIRSVQFKGLTPMGSELKKKIIDECIVNKARSGQLRKPVLVITITDGHPAGEPENTVFETIRYAKNELSRTPYGAGAVAFQFAQVGNDEKAREFLGKLDNDPIVGNMVDCTSNYENESAEMLRAIPPVNLSPELWLVKLLLGAIDSSYDTKDEKGGSTHAATPQYGAAPPQGYGAPPPPLAGQYNPHQPPPPHQNYPPHQAGYSHQPPPSINQYQQHHAYPQGYPQQIPGASYPPNPPGPGRGAPPPPHNQPYPPRY